MEECLKILKSPELLERLAEVEHDQWVRWSKEIAASEHISGERIERWRKYWVSYRNLSEKDKEKDREWARKVLAVLRDYLAQYS